MNEPAPDRSHDRWARLRFSIVGRLLAAPPKHGELQAELKRLSEREWRHPISQEAIRFGISTIERWYYQALAASKDPVVALRRQPRSDAGQHGKVSAPLRTLIKTQYEEHPTWRYQLHLDNLAVEIEKDPSLGPLPSYATVRRYMKSMGLIKQRKRGPQDGDSEQHVAIREPREVRSFEAPYVHSLWHLDFHELERPVLASDGTWHEANLLAILDDHSRYGCHAQWYLNETAEVLVHGFSQAIQKCGLPWELMRDNGPAMRAAEFLEGLAELSIIDSPTLPYSPEQNGKQEKFFDLVTGRLVAMLENVENLTLTLLNEATQAWFHLDYNRKLHSEIGTSPLQRFVSHRSVGRESPSSRELKDAFRACARRKQRHSDGTISLLGRRFEIPTRYRHLDDLHVRFAHWDLASVDLFDARSRKILCPIYPVDKTKNADRRRRRLPEVTREPSAPPARRIAPLLEKLMAEYAATGLPPAYLPKDPTVEE